MCLHHCPRFRSSVSFPLTSLVSVQLCPLDVLGGINTPSSLPARSTGCHCFACVKPQRARPETCCPRCWSSTPLNGYRWTRPYSTPTSTSGTIQLRWKRWVGRDLSTRRLTLYVTIKTQRYFIFRINRSSLDMNRKCCLRGCFVFCLHLIFILLSHIDLYPTSDLRHVLAK